MMHGAKSCSIDIAIGRFLSGKLGCIQQGTMLWRTETCDFEQTSLSLTCRIMPALFVTLLSAMFAC